MLYEYIIKTFDIGEPIFLSDLPGKSKDYIRQEMKKLADEGKIERVYNGVYFIPYTTILGTKGKININDFLNKKYLLNDNGYYTGLELANIYGFTTQNSACYEICSNFATTTFRKLEFDGFRYIVKKPVVNITSKNKTALQFLDLMTDIDKYSEVEGEELKNKIYNFIEKANVDMNEVKAILPLYPDRTFRNIYFGGIMSELV